MSFPHVGPPAPDFTVAPTDAFYTLMDYSTGSSASRTYTLRNNSASPLSWTASKTETWFDLSATSGSIPAGGSTTVNIALNAETANLSMDTHEAITTFTDTSNTITEERKVILSIGPNDSLRGYWKLDETGDETVAADQSVFKNDGTLSGGSWINGHYGGALAFDGNDDLVSVGNVPMKGQMTLSAWINPSSFDGDRGIVGSDGSFTMKTTGTGELCFTTPGIRDHNSSGANLVLDSWQHVAITFDANQADGTCFYVNGSQVSQMSASGFNAGSSNFKIGANQWGQHFHGAIDDLRIYDKILSASELQDIYEGGGAECPNPCNLAINVHIDRIQWEPGATATNHHVYVGTNQTAVASATPTSPEFKGMTPDSLFRATLADQTPYYWRIDTVTDSATLPGSVWAFTTGTVQDPGNMISVNFEQSSNQDFSGGEMIGPLSSDSTHWNATSGASGSLADLIDNFGTATGVDIAWQCSTTYMNTDGTGDDEHKLSVGYLDDGNSGSGDGATVTINNIPYTAYKVYGLFSSDGSNGGSAMQGLDFNVNGTWVYGGSTPSTTTVYGNINLNQANHGEYWTEIDSGAVIGNYWTMVTSGTTCSITGGIRSGFARGSLAGIIIVKLQDTDRDGIPDDVDTDDDNDGIPDDWETNHGLDPLVDDASEHSDPDPYDNWFEYVSDTDPLNGNSWQTFLIGTEPGTGEPAVRFRTSSNRRYTVRYRTNLVDGVWQDLDPAFTGTGLEITIPDSAIGPQRYYRLQIELP